MRNYVKSLISTNKFRSPGSRNGFYSRANKICSLKPPPIRFREIKNCKQIANGSHICLHLSWRARSGDWKNCSLRYLTPFVHITMDRLFASSAPSSGGRPLVWFFWKLVKMTVLHAPLKNSDPVVVGILEKRDLGLGPDPREKPDPGPLGTSALHQQFFCTRLVAYLPMCDKNPCFCTLILKSVKNKLSN